MYLDLSNPNHQHHENPTDYDTVFRHITTLIDKAAAGGHVLSKAGGRWQRRGAWMQFTVRTVDGEHVGALSYCFTLEADFAACAQHYHRLRRLQKVDRLLS
jgi:hypothetical protein